MQVMLLVLLSCAEKKQAPHLMHAYIEIVYLINILFRLESVM
mgnify:CR=1 FL=1